MSGRINAILVHPIAGACPGGSGTCFSRLVAGAVSGKAWEQLKQVQREGFCTNLVSVQPRVRCAAWLPAGLWVGWVGAV